METETANGNGADLIEVVRDLYDEVRSRNARVSGEPLTYRRDAGHSYFRDLVLRRQDARAQARLDAHAAEMRVELPKREERAQRAAEQSLAERGFEYRVTPSRTQGQGGFFAPPLWLIDQFATAPRPARVLAELAPGFSLPQGAQSINLPRLTTGLQTGTQTDDSAVTSRDPVDAQVSSPVVTIAGQGDVPVQLIEQSPAGAHLDWAFFKDLTADYDAQFEAQLINGSGSNGQLQGLLGLTGKGADLTYTSGSPTLQGIFPYFGQAAAGIGDNRLQPPEIWLMRTARWAWLGTASDSSNRPFAVPNHAPVGPQADLFDPNSPTPVTDVLGWPVYPDDAIPANLGSGNNEDRIIACKPSDLILFESEPRTAVMFEPVSGTMQARLQLRGYAAAITGRYPSGVGVIKGTGAVVQSGF